MSLLPHEGAAARHGLYQALIHQDVDGTPHGPHGQAGLGGQIRDRGQLGSDFIALDLRPQLGGELLVRVLG
jgi:hypothetical protein